MPNRFRDFSSSSLLLSVCECVAVQSSLTMPPKRFRGNRFPRNHPDDPIRTPDRDCSRFQEHPSQSQTSASFDAPSANEPRRRTPAAQSRTALDSGTPARTDDEVHNSPSNYTRQSRNCQEIFREYVYGRACFERPVAGEIFAVATTGRFAISFQTDIPDGRSQRRGCRRPAESRATI